MKVGIRILPGESRRTFAEATAIGARGRETEVRKLAAKIREQSWHGEGGSQRPDRRIGIVLGDVVRGVAGDKFIQQLGRQRCRQAGDHLHSGADEVRADGRKAFASPGYSGFGRIPGIVNRAEREPRLGIEVVIDADQIFAPVGGLSDGRGINRIRAGAKVRRRNHVHQDLGVGVN